MAGKREYYSSSIAEFIKTENEIILGQLSINDEFKTEDLQKNAWRDEIIILKDQLRDYKEGSLALEYTVPRIGSRIDVVCIIQGVIFLLEFKVGDNNYKKSTSNQVMDYALDLKYFHEASKDRYIIPINVSTVAPRADNNLVFSDDKISDVLCCNKTTIHECINLVLNKIHDSSLDIKEWSNSRYAPTPTIIEAARALYNNHSVEDISRNDAGAKNLTLTTQAINRIIDSCKREHKKAICFVTGVPGAGKTLAGLNIANDRQRYKDDEHAVFLSGNGPLVDVLQEALAIDKAERDNIPKRDAKRETKAFIQIIHRFRDEALSSNNPPIEEVAIFDEAQRAWDKDSLANFMKTKKGIPNFNQSEPEFLIDFMNRHKDWAVIVCLVGGGQEIYNGEAGITNWFDVLKNKYNDWEIYLSDKMSDSEYIGDSTIDKLLNGRSYKIEPDLHLAVSLRSFRSEKLSAFIKELLDNNPKMASQLYGEISKTYPVVMTRDFDKAKRWVKEKSRGSERYGLLASSGGRRLRGDGIWVLPEIDHVKWFLGDRTNINSSYYLEVAASEFKVQGLEIDYGVIAWDADFRYNNGKFECFQFRGDKWMHINKEQRQKYLKNAYRVLLTRSRQGFVIYIPSGCYEDDTRRPEYYDGIYRYLQQVGIKEI